MSKEDYIASPSQMFTSPNSILICDFLSHKEKETALMNWKSTCEDLERATDEGMTGETNELLSVVVKALADLRNTTDLH